MTKIKKPRGICITVWIQADNVETLDKLAEKYGNESKAINALLKAEELEAAKEEFEEFKTQLED